MAAVPNAAAAGGGSGLTLTSAQTAAGATGVIASDSSGNAYKQDGTAFSGGGGSIPTTTAILKGNGAGGAAAATAGTDYLAPAAIATTSGPLAGDGAGNAIAATSFVVGQPIISVISQPYGIAPSGATIGASGGALTLTTAFIETYGPTGAVPFDGIWLWFEAGATDTSSLAGFYWTVMTSTTAGTVFSNYLAPGSSALNKPPATPTAYTTNVGKVGTVGTTAQIVGWVIPTNMAAGYLGANGFVEIAMSQRTNISAGLKTLQPKFIAGGTGGNAQPAVISLTTTSSIEMTMKIVNKNNASRQGTTYVCNSSAFPLTTAPAGLTATTGTQPVSVGVDLKLATSTDWVVCQFAAVRAWPAV